MKINRLDHLVLTVENVDRTCEWYHRVLDFAVVEFGNGRRALTFDEQKINLHQLGHGFEPKAQHPTPGSADLCFIAEMPMAQIVEHLQNCEVEVIKGPIERTGAKGAIFSIYFRDPDGDLVEISNYL